MSPSPSQSPKQAPRDLLSLAHSPETVNAPPLLGTGLGRGVGCDVGVAEGTDVGTAVTDGKGVDAMSRVFTEPLSLVSQHRYQITVPSVA